MEHFNYEEDTRSKYRNEEIAKRYKEIHTKGFARLATKGVKECVGKALDNCNLSGKNIILDMPCGTGVLADILLQRRNDLIIASDISIEMMNLALADYKGDNCCGFIQGDATKTPFKDNTFGLVVNIGLMHRVPIDIKRRILKEMASISNQYIIISFSVTSLVQRLKLALVRIFIRHHKPSPCPIFFKELKSEIEEAGLEIIRVYRVFPFLSSQVILLLRKRESVKNH